MLLLERSVNKENLTRYQIHEKSVTHVSQNCVVHRAPLPYNDRVCDEITEHKNTLNGLVKTL